MARPIDWAGRADRAALQTGRYVLRSVALQDLRIAREPMDDGLPELGELEHEVMQLVWAHGPITAEEVRERLSRRLKESTVRTVLRRLEDKGYTTHTVDGRTYVYQAARSEEHTSELQS